MHRHRPTTTATRLACALAVCVALPAAAAPALEETTGRVTVANAHFAITFDADRGGGISEIRLADGSRICGGHAVYSDWGIFPGRVYFGTVAAPATLSTRRDGGSIMVRADTEFCDPSGKPASEPGGLACWFEATITDAPEVHVGWGVTPSFTMEVQSAFLSYILPVEGLVGTFANTQEGVLLQDAAQISTRTVQSATDPLSAADPWIGFMRADGRVVAFTNLHGTPSLENVFFHEDGKGNSGVFFAWLCGGARQGFETGTEWRGGFTIQLAESFEQFRAQTK